MGNPQRSLSGTERNVQRLLSDLQETEDCIVYAHREAGGENTAKAGVQTDHVGALPYAKDFASKVIVCEVDPEDVVCVPYDSSQQKMRVCRYKVIGNHNGEFMPDTVIAAGDDDADEDVSYCDECGAGIPDSEEREENHHHTIECSLYVDDVDPPDEDEIKPKTNKQKKQAHKAKKKIGKQMAQLHDLGTTELMLRPIGELRTYASKVLNIVGASKIPGGKVALVKRIIAVKS